MVLNYFKKKKNPLPIGLFVTAALANFFLALLVVVIFKSTFVFPDSRPQGASSTNNPGVSSSDPLLTRMPALEDFIVQPLNTAADPAAGPGEASVIISQFGDFLCPECKANLEAALELTEKYPGQVKFIWKDFPGTDIGSSAWQAALSARCAAEQDNFFPYAASLFSPAGNWTQDTFANLAEKLGLNKKNFENCLKGYKNNKLIIDNLTEAEALGISGVPTIYVNDRKFSGEIPEEELNQAVKEELKLTGSQ